MFCIDMDKMIRKLHTYMLREKGCKDKICHKTRKEILGILKANGKQMEGEEYEYFLNEIFLAASAAEENGFVDGFRYAFRLFYECKHK